MRARHAAIRTEQVLKALKQTQEQRDRELAEEDEASVRSIVRQNSAKYVRQLDDDEHDEDDDDNEEAVGIMSLDKKRKLALTSSTALGKKRKLLRSSTGAKNPLVEHLPDENLQGERSRSSQKQVLGFALRPKAVAGAFNVKPKVASNATGGQVG